MAASDGAKASTSVFAPEFLTPMKRDDTTELLKDFSILRTADPGAARRAIKDRFGFDLIAPDAPDFFARGSLVELSSISLFCAASSLPLRVQLPASDTTYVRLFLRGGCAITTGKSRVEAAEGEALVCSPGRAAQLDYSADHEQLVLIIPPATLDRAITKLTGIPSRLPIAFEPAIPPDDPRYAGFRDLMLLLAGGLDRAFSAWPQATLVHLEQALVGSLLFCSRHNLRRLLSPEDAGTVPAPVRIAEHYAELRCESEIAVEDMARAAAVSVSTLTRMFLKFRGMSPSAFIKRTKLAHARQLLESGAASTVIGVALRCGFTNPSRFANDYREAFDESPTETLRRRRPAAPPNLQKY